MKTIQITITAEIKAGSRVQWLIDELLSTMQRFTFVKLNTAKATWEELDADG